MFPNKIPALGISSSTIDYWETAMKWFWGTSGSIGAIVVLLLVWGFVVEPRFLLDTTEHGVKLPNLPETWEGEQVALLADFQIGMWWHNLGMIEEAVEEVIEAQPALLVIAGDFLYQPDSAKVQIAAELMRPLGEAGITTLAVLGNHDYSLMHEDSKLELPIGRYLEQELERVGVRVIENEAVPLRLRNGEPLYVAGVGSVWADRSAPQQAVSGIPSDAARVVFMHNPEAYRELPAYEAPLTLAGHTHGGQVRIPILDTESWLDIVKPREVIADGWSKDDVGNDGNQMYVNRGIGFSNVPVRLFCRPELTLFTLTRAQDNVASYEADI
ncbi:MAG: metallophosphoesterase [Rhodothermales bacterium]